MNFLINFLFKNISCKIIFSLLINESVQYHFFKYISIEFHSSYSGSGVVLTIEELKFLSNNGSCGINHYIIISNNKRDLSELRGFLPGIFTPDGSEHNFIGKITTSQCSNSYKSLLNNSYNLVMKNIK